MNCLAYGKARDSRVISLIDQGGAFTRQQIERILFSNRKSGRRICQYRLKQLVERKQIKKWVRNPQEPSIYYIRKPRNIDHALMINEAYCALMQQKRNWMAVDFRWSYPLLGGKVWPDAAAIIYTDPDRRGKQVVFIEVERNPGKRFNKPQQYQKIFDADWLHEEWAIFPRPNQARFPSILIVTEYRLKIDSPLRFIVATPEQVRKDIYSLILRRD